MEAAINAGAAPVRARSVDSRLKRSVDIAGSLVALVILAPVLLITSLVIVATSGWPPLYEQRRVGLDGKTFVLWKFRTMIRDADSLRDSLLALNEASFPAFKLNRDPRVTPIGRILRRSSVDELPQLWNVIRGEMSLVGPRPPLPFEVSHYDAYSRRRLSAKPGITGPWQVDHRHGTEMQFHEWVRLDIEYIENWSISTDLRLMARTIPAVARLDGR